MSLPQFHLQLNQKLSHSFTLSCGHPQSEWRTAVQASLWQKGCHEHILPGGAVTGCLLGSGHQPIPLQAPQMHLDKERVHGAPVLPSLTTLCSALCRAH